MKFMQANGIAPDDLLRSVASSLGLCPKNRTPRLYGLVRAMRKRYKFCILNPINVLIFAIFPFLQHLHVLCSMKLTDYYVTLTRL